jgi:hypothetical protein
MDGSLAAATRVDRQCMDGWMFKEKKGGTATVMGHIIEGYISVGPFRMICSLILLNSARKSPPRYPSCWSKHPSV